MSDSKVRSAPMLFSAWFGVTVRGSLPQDNSYRCSAAAWPTTLAKVLTGVFAMSETLTNPSRESCSAVFSPTPQSAPIGSGCKNSITLSAGTTCKPSGFAKLVANFATNIVEATPTEQVIPCSSLTRALITSPI